MREMIEQFELDRLSPFAIASVNSEDRERPETPCDVRTDFQRDVDRIIHTKSFRRLMHKTQVFLNPEGDHYRTRMVHTLEVSRIARTLARALQLNEDLTEAIALGHDLGHTPFGHAGERALDMSLQNLEPATEPSRTFSHNAQSLRVVEVLENGGRGLNLTGEVRDGILHHSGEVKPRTLEGQLVHISDRIAYVNHDIDDAIRAGLFDNIPLRFCDALGATHRERINTLVVDVIHHSYEKPEVGMSPAVEGIFLELRAFLFERVYRDPVAKGEEGRARDMLTQMFGHYVAHPNELPEDFRTHLERDELPRVVCDYLAGMTDRYAVSQFSRLTIPRGWVK